MVQIAVIFESKGALMPDRSYELHGVCVLECAADGVELRSAGDAVELITAARAHHARYVVVPVARLGDDFFNLRTGIAGEIIQRFVNYSVRLVIAGDISRHVAESTSLRDLVRESNRGDQVWFFASLDELSERLHRARERRGLAEGFSG